MEIKIKMIPGCEDLIPSYAHETDSGIDLRSTEDGVLKAGERMLVGTGVCLDLPTEFVAGTKLEAQVRSRSGLAIKSGIFVLNSPGTIDSGYRNEIKVILMNLSKEDFSFKRGDRIAQLVITSVLHADIKLVNEVSSTDRGLGGFGSTGVH